MECVVTPGGHEIDFDRILVEELQALGHTVEFYVPVQHEFKWNYGVPVHHIAGRGVSYQGAHGLRKLYLSAKRELHRQKWYSQMYEYAVKNAFDAIIFPSATYRYLRALSANTLKNSPVPVLFLIHGATPEECIKLDQEAKKFDACPNIRIGVQSFVPQKLRFSARRIRVYGPPNYIPRDIDAEAYRQAQGTQEVLRLGFFGQYRKEKNLDAFLEVFTKCSFERPLKLIVQGATQTPEDAADFNRIITKYEGHPWLEFWHRPLIGIDWQRGLASVDAIVMPYGNERYLYHTSAIISNAIGYKKAIICADTVNPEILQSYEIGTAFHTGDAEDMKAAIEKFVNTYDAKKETYAAELQRAYDDFSPARLAKNIAALAQGGNSEHV